jgi:hypothetical protein
VSYVQHILTRVTFFDRQKFHWRKELPNTIIVWKSPGLYFCACATLQRFNRWERRSRGVEYSFLLFFLFCVGGCIFSLCVWLTGCFCCCCLGFALLFRSLAQRDSTKGQHNEYPTFSTAVAFSCSPPPLDRFLSGVFSSTKEARCVVFQVGRRSPSSFPSDSECYVNRITSHLIGKWDFSSPCGSNSNGSIHFQTQWHRYEPIVTQIFPFLVSLFLFFFCVLNVCNLKLFKKGFRLQTPFFLGGVKDRTQLQNVIRCLVSTHFQFSFFFLILFFHSVKLPPS